MSKVDINSPEIAILREEAEKRLGYPVSTPRHFSALSLDIENNLKEYISETTLQRVWRYKCGYDTVAIHTLNVLSRYIGEPSWEAFQETVLRRSKCESQLFSEEQIDIEKLAPGTILRIGWRPDRTCLIKYLGDYTFEAVETHNAKLVPGDRFTCRRMQLGRELILDNLVRSEREMSYVAGARNGLTLLEII